MNGVHKDLVTLSTAALNLSDIDFGITEGVRSKERQRLLRDTGKSQTLNSPHIPGMAVDVVAYHDGKYTYEPFSLYTDIAEAYRMASLQTGIPVTWGAAWLASLSNYDSAEDALAHYKETRRKQGRRPFLDGVHFELERKRYGW
jgi:peptidoglycan L-alanyl-D-glutamate endopeptidase CwlK